MVQDEIQLQVDAQILQIFEILRPGDISVDVIADDGETTVKIRAVQAGEDVDGTEGALPFIL